MLLMKTFALVVCPLFALSLAQAQDLPAGQGKDVVERVCTACHDLGPVAALTGTKEVWQSVIDDMKVRGADGSDADFTAIINYLGKYLGPPVHVNTAAAKDLQTQLDITAAESDAIVKYRTDKGNFKTWEDLQKVSGVDMAKLEPLKKRIKFD